jgi:hypothetical protein
MPPGADGRRVAAPAYLHLATGLTDAQAADNLIK